MKAKVKIGITAAETKFIRTVKYTGMNYKRNENVSKELKSEPILDSVSKYKSNWIVHDDRTQRDRLPRLLKSCR
jgi:hypothetical protein